MDRYTSKDAERCARNLAKVLNKEFGNCWIKENGKWKAKIGCWNLSYNPIYGGCVIEEIVNEAGGVTHPLLRERLPPREFCKATEMAIKAVDICMKKR
ncbi:MAG: hypothetical protein ACTSWZ_07660 [Candidatus Heimdallarchaeaceae archaeon]